MTHRNIVLSTFSALTVGLSIVAAPSAARNGTVFVMNSSHNQRAPDQQSEQRQEIISGRIAKSRRGLVLRSSGRVYTLEHAAGAAHYAGKRVLVTGIVDAKSRTIQVLRIQPIR